MLEKESQYLAGVKIGIVLTGSHCTIPDVIPQIRKLKELGAEIYPVFSYTVDQTDNRFYKVDDLKKMIADISDKPIINTIVANGIVDTPALMAVKAHLRNQRPVVIGISTNDALSINAKNIGLLLNMKNIYFVPFRQDSPHTKANSVIAVMDYICETVIEALKGKQFQPLLLGPA